LPHSLTSLLVVAAVLMASAPSVLLQPDQQTRPELNRWFLNGRTLHSTPSSADDRR
jgi:hypothetical protein